MTQKDTIAIIGALNETGRSLVKGIMKFPFHLLLMDEAPAQLPAFLHELAPLRKLASVDTLECSREASWEADIIIITGSKDAALIAAHIRDVATGKVIIQVITSSSNGLEQLQQLLPHSMVAQVVLSTERSEALEKNYKEALIEGYHTEAIETAVTLMQAIGWQPIIKNQKENSISKN